VHARIAPRHSLYALGGFLLAGAVLAPSLTGRAVFFPADFWMGSVPFGTTASDPHNPMLSDYAFLYAPPLAVVHAGLRAGTFPLWNRFLGGGEPLLGTGLSGPLEPLNWPILLLPWPDGFAWAAWLRFGLMWLGAYLFARSLALDAAWSLTVAIGFCFAPGFLVHFDQLPRADAHMTLPWLLWGVERIRHAGSAGRRATLHACLPMALATFAAASAVYPPAAFNVSFATIMYLLLRLPSTPWRDALWARVVGLGAMGLGFAMAAPSLMPFMDLLRDSATFAEREHGGQWTLPAEALRLFWNPYALGSPITGSGLPWTGAINFEEEQQYIGVLPWVFLIASIPFLRRRGVDDRRRLLVLGALALLTAALAFGWEPVHAWVTRVPPFSRNSNPRMLFLTQVCVSVLAAIVSRDWLGGERKPRTLAFGCLVAAAFAGGLATFALGLSQQWSIRAPFALGSAMALFAAGGLAASRAERRAALALVPILLLLDLSPVYRGYFPQPPRYSADPVRAVRNLPPVLREEPHPRVVFEDFTPANLPAVFGVEDVRSYAFPVPRRYDAYMRRVLGVRDPEKFVIADLLRLDVLAGLEQTCAGWLWTSIRYDAPARLRLEPTAALPTGPWLYRMAWAAPCAAWHADGEIEGAFGIEDAAARVRASLLERPERIFVERPIRGGVRAVAGVPATMQWHGANELEIEVPAEARGRDGWLVVRVSWDPGWRAFAGKEELDVAPAQVRFLAVATPAGTDRVRLRYRPLHFALWLAVAGAAGSATAGLWIWSRSARRERDAVAARSASDAPRA